MRGDFNKEDRDAFIEENMAFIYRTASFICKKKLDKRNDEEFSIAMEAFNRACDTFSMRKGNFLSYAKVVIKNYLIDFFRKSKKIPMLYFDNEEGSREIDNSISLTKYEMELENKSRMEEIQVYKQCLAEFGIDFFTLSENSPSHKDTRDELLNLAIVCIANRSIREKLEEGKRLPVNDIIKLTGRNRKFIEKWRRYLISLIILLSNEDFIYLRAYLNIRKEERK